MIKFFDPGKSYLKIKDEVDAAMQRVLAAGDLILRNDVEQFEEAFAKYVGTTYAIGVNSGTDALLLALQACDIGRWDVVVAPSYTFRATVDSAIRTGANVELYDKGERPDLEGMDAWIPAHIAGEVESWVPAVIEECKFRDVVVIEDAAQAIGAAPVMGAAACYSFYPAKILGCYGDGGAVATNSKEIYDYIKRARNHFKGETGPVGMNSRLDNLQAAVLNVKLKYLPDAITRRKQVAELYDAGLEGVKKPKPRAVYQDYIIEYKNVGGLKDFLAKNGIETMENGYPFAEMFTKGPKTLAYEANSLRIPCNENLTDEEVQEVITRINEYINLH